MSATKGEAPAAERTADAPAPEPAAADAHAASEAVDAPAARQVVGVSTGDPVPHVWRPPRKRLRTIALILFLGAAALLAVLTAWDLPPFGGGAERTDNAYVRGLTMNVAPQVSGYVVAVEIRDYEQVHAGQVLARIDDRIYRARVAAAQASLSAQRAGLTNARAQLLRARADMARVDDLVRDGSVS